MISLTFEYKEKHRDALFGTYFRYFRNYYVIIPIYHFAMESASKKRKVGGAERQRMKAKEEREKTAKKCQKLDTMFAKKLVKETTSTTDISIPTKSVAMDISNERPSTSTSNEKEPSDSNSNNIEHLDSVQSPSVEQCVVNIVSETNLTEANLPLPTNDEMNFDYFKIPDSANRSLFLKYHPQQPINGEFNNWNKTFYHKNKKRAWLTYSEKNKALYCFICMAYGSHDKCSNLFVRGLTDFKRGHHYARISGHENSGEHTINATAFFLDRSHANVRYLLHNESLNLRNEQIQFRRDVLKRIIDVIKLIGKCGLSYRGKRNEAAYLLDHPELEHGVALEILLLLRKYDSTLNLHLTNVIAESKKAHDDGNKKRTNFLTFVSKTTLNYIIEAIRTLMQKMISAEVNEAGMYSIQLDTTQDISVTDQCAIVVRYVKNTIVYERLLDVVQCTSSTGQSILELFKNVILANGIDVKKCVGNSTDGAANMQGHYNGFTAWLNNETLLIHVWCYAHVLNLFISDITKVSLAAISLFGLMNDIAVFFRESYQRMDIWRKVTENCRKTLSKINDTRWNSKHTILGKVFGEFGNPEKALYIPLVEALFQFANDQNNASTARDKANGYLQKLLKFETIATAHIYLRIFEISTPLSMYLQSSGLDFMKCNDFVRHFKEKISAFSRDYKKVQNITKKFAESMNVKFEEKNFDGDISVETEFPVKRTQKRKKRSDESPSTSKDEVTYKDLVRDANRKYEVEIHNAILDTAVAKVNERFHEEMYRSFAYLDLRNFQEISEETLPLDGFKKLSELLIKFDSEATPQNLKRELIHFAQNWENLKKSLTDLCYETDLNDDDADFLDEDLDLTDQEEDKSKEDESQANESKEDESNTEHFKPEACGFRSSKSYCKNCIICCWYVLEKYSLISGTYGVIGLAYKYFATQSVTQVACERSFSKLRFIKNRLRSTISQERLSSFMLMSIEKDILEEISSDQIIDLVAAKSKLLTKKLIF